MKRMRWAMMMAMLALAGNNVKAQFYPYNPYNPYGNAGYALGQQIGSAIQRNNKYGRNQLRKAIKKWGECNNGTLSLEHGADTRLKESYCFVGSVVLLLCISGTCRLY